MSRSQDLKALAEVRSQTWWFLGRLYLDRPEPGLLAELGAALAAAEPSAETLDKEVQVMRDCLAGEEPGALSLRLKREFTRLFRGIAEQYGPPPPYESLYRGAQLMGEPASDVQRHFQAAGLSEVVPEAGPQDHIGAELCFLSLLCYRESEAWAAGDEESAQTRIGQQRIFLDAHLLAWLPAYAARIAEESREPFYCAAARLTAQYALAARADLDALEAELDAA